MSSTEKKPKVLIVGAGIGGLTLGAILEKANIPYEIFEKASALKPLGSAISVGPPVIPMFIQLGIFDQIVAKGAPVTTSRMHSEKNEVILDVDYTDKKTDRFGWPGYIISRPNLHNALINLIPPERIHLNKRVLSHVETGIGIIIRTSDNMTHEGNILVGADGTYSAVRQALYEQLGKDGKLPSSDKEPLRYSTICLVGQTRPMEPSTYEYSAENVCTSESVLMDEKPLFVVTFTTAEKTICWMVLEFLDGESTKKHDNFRSSEWGPEAAEAMCKEIRDVPAVRGLKMGDLIDASPKEVICKVVLEEKLFETWTHGRTVLIGDACHKMHPAAGLGAQSAMNDAVVLANYINTLTTIESGDVEKALKAYKDERYPVAKAAIKRSSGSADSIKQGYGGRIKRFIVKHMPNWLWLAVLSDSCRSRPQISFLPLAEDKCKVKPMYQPSLEKTRPKNMAMSV
ncbi:hypothetical protein BGZ49_010729 [Haplosporangium sp. Z 27]|nr:hypothetical protein BGZ49_010729 [Haplosporangium sp. Z 27]